MTTTINKIPYDFHDTLIDIMVNGESVASIEGITSLDYSDSVEFGDLRGRGRKILDVTDGELSSEASVTVYRYAYDQIVEVCRTLGLGWYDLRFDLSVVYSHGDSLARTDRITRCRFAGREQSHSASPDALVVTLPIKVAGEIICDGVPAMT